MSTPNEPSGGYRNGSNGRPQAANRADAAPQPDQTYPLRDNPSLRAASGRPLNEVTLEAAAQGELSPQDLQIGAGTLLAQAEVARRAGFAELAANLTRAAELTAVPNAELLRMYEMLRPHRATYMELTELAHTLETEYAAPVTAAFVREAAQVYQTRNLLRRE